MNEDRLNLIIGAALIVIGISGMWYFTRQLERLNKSSHMDREDFLHDTWNDLTKMKFYKNSTPEEQQSYYDAFWKNTKN